jgi:hypothetical protein
VPFGMSGSAPASRMHSTSVSCHLLRPIRPSLNGGSGYGRGASGTSPASHRSETSDGRRRTLSARQWHPSVLQLVRWTGAVNYRSCRVEGGYARPDLPLWGRLRSPGLPRSGASVRRGVAPRGGRRSRVVASSVVQQLEVESYASRQRRLAAADEDRAQQQHALVDQTVPEGLCLPVGRFTKERASNATSLDPRS